MRTQTRYLIALVACVVAIVPGKALGQAAAAAAPAPCPTDALTTTTNTVSDTATTVSKDTTTLANAGTQLNTAEQKFNGMVSGWGKKPKTTPTTTATTKTTTATNTATTKATQVSSAAGAAGSGGTKAPCKPAGAAGANVASNGQPPVAGKPASPTETAGAAGAPTFTKMPDGDYMLGYTGSGAGAQATYAKVKLVSPPATPSAANPHDGIYTDGKSFFSVTDGKLTVTPIGGVASK